MVTPIETEVTKDDQVSALMLLPDEQSAVADYNDGKLMSSEKWYQRFVGYFGYDNKESEIIETPEAMARWALKAARLAAGTEVSPQAIIRKGN